MFVEPTDQATSRPCTRGRTSVRKLLQNPLRRQRLTRFRQPIAAIAHGVQSGAQSPARTSRLSRPRSGLRRAPAQDPRRSGTAHPPTRQKHGRSMAFRRPITRPRAAAQHPEPARARLGTRTHARYVGPMRECNQRRHSTHRKSTRGARGTQGPTAPATARASAPSIDASPQTQTESRQPARWPTSAATATDPDPTRHRQRRHSLATAKTIPKRVNMTQ